MTLAESGAERTRRWRSHKAGDHSLCKHRGGARDTSPGGADGPPAPSTAIPAGDKARLGWLATTLAQAYRDDPGNALLARELRMTLQALLGGGGGKSHDGDLDELFAEFSEA